MAFRFFLILVILECASVFLFAGQASPVSGEVEESNSQKLSAMGATLHDISIFPTGDEEASFTVLIPFNAERIEVKDLTLSFEGIVLRPSLSKLGTLKGTDLGHYQANYVFENEETALRFARSLSGEDEDS